MFWAIGQVVKLKYGREHTSEALEIWAFYVLGCVHDAHVQGVFTALLCSVQLSEAVIFFAKIPDSDLTDIKRLSRHEFALKSLN